MAMFNHPVWVLLSTKEFVAVVYAIACLKIIVG
jgi:hypothetical protein